MEFNKSGILLEQNTYEREFERYLDAGNMNLIHIIRCDGKKFSNYTKGFKYPFDNIFRTTMKRTMLALCEEVQGSFFGYTQSDEITVMFKKQSPESQIYYNGRVNKIIGVVSSIVTTAFNNILMEEYEKTCNEYKEQIMKSNLSLESKISLVNEFLSKMEVYKNKVGKANFDCKVFSMPREKAIDNFILRRDNSRVNAISMIARAHFSHSELQDIKTEELISKLAAINVDINDIDPKYIYGIAAYKKDVILYEGQQNECIRLKWVTDEDLSSLSNKEFINLYFNS